MNKPYDIRVISKFLILPKTLRRQDGQQETRWWERVEIRQQLEFSDTPPWIPRIEHFVNPVGYVWTDLEWVN